MPTQPIKWTGVTEGVTTASILIDDTSVMRREWAWHAFVSGTFGGSASAVQLEYSPDLPGTPDGSSTWYAPTALLFTAAGDTYFQAKPRKFRLVLTGGDGTTSVNVWVQ